MNIVDIEQASLARLIEDCTRFQASLAWQATIEDESGDGRAERRQGYGCSIEESAGHDFWLIRRGHGAGFWDGHWKEPRASALDALSKQFGNVDLYAVTMANSMQVKG